ncbi:MAG TPA: hypothetical protein PK156_25745 [Polyangium sp.]|nr:hypothetical protein [Polyangium sp.]
MNAAACKGMNAVCLTAALVDWRLNKRALLRAVNVDGTKHVIAGCRAESVPRLIYTSSVNVVLGAEAISGSEPAGLEARWRRIPGRHCLLSEWANRLGFAGNEPPLLTRFVLASTTRDFWFRGDRARQWLGNYNVVSLDDAREETARWIRDFVGKGWDDGMNFSRI